MKNRVLLFVIILFLVWGCKPHRYFSIDIYEPGKVTIPAEFDSIVLTHNIFPAAGKDRGTPYRIMDEVIYDTTYHDTTLAKAAIYNLADMLNLAGKYRVQVWDSLQNPLPKDAGDFTQHHVNRIRNLCREYNADACIVLNHLEEKVNFDMFYTTFGVSGELMTIVNTDWLFIDPHRSVLLDSHTMKDTLFYYSDDPFQGEGYRQFDLSNELLLETAIESAVKYGSRISPHLVESPRMVFKSGNRDIKRGYKQATEGNWKNAAAFWRDALTDPDPKTKARASFNLALASEMEGMLEPALEWAQKSNAFFPDKVNQTYVDILRERIKQQEKLNRQVGTE
ncbi:MAG: DUF6340 family protein [Bacteroidales bacterium]